MANFESGVASYVHGRAVVDVFFPVDNKGNADASCYQCPYFRRNYQMCGLNSHVVAYPSRYVGVCCPLELDETDQNTERKEGEE